ncbi:tetratricopeptide repeat protein 27 [Tanacetum coccineum]
MCETLIINLIKQALIAFTEALKFNRDSWQIWENYSQVAVDSGNFSLALEATPKVLSLSKNKRIDVNLLDRQIARSGGGGDVWEVFARWHKLKGDIAMCSEVLLKQVRSYQGSELWKEKERFVKFARASLELCKVYVEISSRNGGRRELFTAKMHLKSTVKQAALSFS